MNSFFKKSVLVLSFAYALALVPTTLHAEPVDPMGEIAAALIGSAVVTGATHAVLPAKIVSLEDTVFASTIFLGGFFAAPLLSGFIKKNYLNNFVNQTEFDNKIVKRASATSAALLSSIIFSFNVLSTALCRKYIDCTINDSKPIASLLAVALLVTSSIALEETFLKYQFGEESQEPEDPRDALAIPLNKVRPLR